MSLLDISAAEYHADPCEVPSLSSGIASLLCSRSPAHAWNAHPRLNPDFVRETRDAFDLGTVAHQMFLEGGSNVVVVDAPDWRSKGAKDERAAARSAGKTPLLIKDIARVEAMVQAAYSQLGHHAAVPGLFAEGKPEQTVVWEEDGVQCRARLDWLRDDRTAIDDLKTTTASANPEAWARTMFGIGADVQADFYRRGVAALTGEPPPEFRWAVIECYPPYALSVVSPSPAVLELAERKVDYALDLWKRCLDADEWPAYSREVCYPDLPSFEEARWLAREEREAA